MSLDRDIINYNNFSRYNKNLIIITEIIKYYTLLYYLKY